MENLYNDVYYIVMMNMDADTLYNFCHVNKKYVKVCQNDAFWKEYMMHKFTFYVPEDYHDVELNPVGIIHSWHNMFIEAYHLNKLLEGYDQLTVNRQDMVNYIHSLIKNNHIDVLQMYLVNKQTVVSSIIVDAGVMYNNDVILDYLYKNENLFLLNGIIANYGTPYSYQYFVQKNVIFPPTFPISVIQANNLDLFVYITSLIPVTQKMLDTAIISGSVEITDYIIKNYPNLDSNIGANIIYTSVISKLFGVSKNKERLQKMVTYLLDNHIYGNNSNAVLYATSTGNIAMLDHFYTQGKFDHFTVNTTNPLHNNPNPIAWFKKHNML